MDGMLDNLQNMKSYRDLLVWQSCQCVTDQPNNGQLNHGNFETCEVKALKDAGMENRGDLKSIVAQSPCLGYK